MTDGISEGTVEKLVRLRKENFEQRETISRLQAENERLRAALRYGIGSAINELTARGLPKEWSPRSGIGRMLEALGCKSTFFDEEVRCCLAVELGESMSSGNNQS